MIKNIKKKIYVIQIVFVLVIAGCAGRSAPVVHVLAPLPQKPLCRLAVLPFINETQYPEGDIIAYRVFMANLSRADGFNVVQEGDIRNLYLEREIYPGQLPDLEKMRIIADRLNADLLITGRVTEMSEDKRGGQEAPVLALNLSVMDGKSGKILWTTYHRRKGDQYRKVMHFGLINSMTALARRMSLEIIDSWFNKGLKECRE